MGDVSSTFHPKFCELPPPITLALLTPRLANWANHPVHVQAVSRNIIE